MRVIWTPEALHDRLEIWDYIDADTAWVLTLVHTSRQWQPVRD